MPSTESLDKGSTHHLEETHEKHDTVVEAAADGHIATDAHGNALFEIDHAAEAAIRKKCDMWIVPITFLCYLFCFIDRSNIGNARVAGLERDLGIARTDYGGYGYNLLLTAFYIAYVIFELPASYICKAVGPGRFLPVLVFCFGLFSFVMAFIHNFAQAFAMRFMLGIFESMFLPSLMYYLSRFYRKAEFGFRVGCFFLGAPLAGAFGGLLASGFLAAPGFGMVRSWRVIFFGEGLITMGLGVAAYFLLPDSPAKARFLTPEQRVLAVTRIKSENVGASSLIDGVDRQIIRSAMFNPTTLTMAAYFFFANLPVQGLGFFLPTILREIYPGESTISIQLRSVPPHFLGAVTLFAASLAGWLTNRRAIYMLIALPCLMTGYALFLGVNEGGARYAATFLIAMGSVTTGPLCTTWATVNTTSDTARAATLSTVILGGNLGGLLATWTYIPRFNNAEPRKSQIPGNSLNLAGAITQWLLTLGLLLYMIRRNKQKKEGKDDWRLEGVKDSDAWKLGQKHPGFRFLY